MPEPLVGRDAELRRLEAFLDRAASDGLGDPFIEAEVQIHIGDSHLALGQTAAARRSWRHAAQLLAGLGHPMLLEARRRLADQPPARTGKDDRAVG